MRLKETIIPLLNNPRSRSRIALALGFSDQWVFHQLKKNKVNGLLTTATAVRVIKEELSISDDQEVLESIDQRISSEN